MMEVGLGLKVPENLRFYFDQYKENLANFKFSDDHIAFRSNCWQEFKGKGFPTVKDERWKYTNVQAILKLDLKTPKKVSESDVLECQKYVNKYLPDHYSICFVDGHLVSASNIHGVEFISLNDLFSSDNTQKKNDYLRLKKQHRQLSLSSFDILNSAVSVSGIFLQLNKNVIVDKPVSIVHFSTGREVVNTQPSVCVELQEGAEVALCEHFVGASGSYFTNTLSEITLNQNSILHYLKVQDESLQAYHVGHTSIKLNQNALLNAFNLSLGAKLCRNNLFTYVDKQSEANVNGLYVTRPEQHIDNSTFILHDKELGHSRQLYKGILKNKSRAVFNGKIKISKNAQKVDSAQMNKNILLGKKAEVDSKPELEVYADDVKANHGSATGEMDHSELFYFMTRGISKNKAITMLSRGYAEDAVFKMQNKEQIKLTQKLLDEVLDEDFFGSDL